MDFTQAQIEVVRTAIATFPTGDWQAALLDGEILEMPDGFDTDCCGVVLLQSGDGTLTQDQFYLDQAARHACVNLYLQRKNDAGDVIGGFVLRIDRSGRYRFEFNVEAKRLNGVWDAESADYRDNYLTHYLREQAG